MQKLGIGWKGDRLRLHRGVDRDPLVVVGTDCTGDFSWEKAIEKKILRVLGSSEFSHSLGHFQTSADAITMSAFLPLATTERTSLEVRFVPYDKRGASRRRGETVNSSETIRAF